MVRYWPRRLVCIACLCGLVFASTPGVWLDVPFFKQEKDGCGAASIAMVMHYWLKQQNKTPDAAADPVEIQRNLYSSKEHGILAADLERYFQQHGFQIFAFKGKWEDLKQHLEKGRPLIVALRPSALESQLHYVVVVGVDTEQNIVYMNDAAQRKLLKQDRTDFEKQWSSTKQWTLLALPR